MCRICSIPSARPSPAPSFIAADRSSNAAQLVGPGSSAKLAGAKRVETQSLFTVSFFSRTNSRMEPPGICTGGCSPAPAIQSTAMLSEVASLEKSWKRWSRPAME